MQLWEDINGKFTFLNIYVNMLDTASNNVNLSAVNTQVECFKYFKIHV